MCDCCGGCIGGARLFCLDCEPKDTETFQSVDLCCAQACAVARVTHRKDIKVPHEPNHKLVKVRTVVLYRQHGRVHTAALAAFERVETLCAKIAESSQKSVEKDKGKEGNGPNSKMPSSPEPTPEETSSESEHGQRDDAPGDTTVETKDSEGTSQGLKDENAQDGTQPQDSELPSCGKCKSRLSFPCWYCIYCEGMSGSLIYSSRVLIYPPALSDDLFLCDRCDREGVPELMRISGKHTEGHHLIRCLAPEEDHDVPSMERRLISLEERIDSMQSRFDVLTGRIGNIEQLLQRLATASEALRS